jgi:hypothetical protein
MHHHFAIVRRPKLFAACALVGAMWSLPAAAIDLDVRLKVTYNDEMNAGSGGFWELAAKSGQTEFGIAALSLRLTGIDSGVQRLAPRGTVNGDESAGFFVFSNDAQSGHRNITIGQASLGSGPDQTVFYGVGTQTTGSPDFAGKDPLWNSIGPFYSTLTNVENIPWATEETGTPWETAALFLMGSFSPGATPNFFVGTGAISNGVVFTALTGTVSASIPLIPGENAIVDTNLMVPSGVLGDYNGDTLVNAADYTTWRNNLGGDAAAAFAPGTRDPMNGGPINQLDYDFWKTRYGMGPGAGGGLGLGSTAVPEPGCGWLVVAGFGLLLVAGSRSVQRRTSPYSGFRAEQRKTVGIG